MNEDWPVPHTYTVHITGGARGKRRGTAMVLHRERGTERAVAISTRQPRRLDHLLTEWLETPPEG